MKSWSYPEERFKSNSRKFLENGMSIPEGNGQSYGDSNFVFGGATLKSSKEVFTINLEQSTLIASGGYSIYETQNLLAKYNLSLAVVPGTSRATLGGCIASDIHGKNSHIRGSFGKHLLSIELEVNEKRKLITPNDRKLWSATIGGQGLTGKIETCEISLISLQNYKLDSRIIFAESIDNFFEVFRKEGPKNDFCVGWLGKTLFRKSLQGYIHVANENKIGKSNLKYTRQKSYIKSWMPRLKLLSKCIFRVYNSYQVYWAKSNREKINKIDRHKYLFPNYNLGYWNYLFGKKGFHEFQFYVPFGEEGLAKEIIRTIGEEQEIFLIGVKIMSGKQIGLMSFCSTGWSIAIDFPATKKSTLQMMKYYDLLTTSASGRIYLTKDWVLTKEYMKKMYPLHTNLIKIREELGIRESINSEMSLRLEI